MTQSSGNAAGSRQRRRLAPTLTRFPVAAILAALTALSGDGVFAQARPLEEIVVTADGSRVTLPEAYPGGQVARGGRFGLLGNLDMMDVPFNATAYTEMLIRDQQSSLRQYTYAWPFAPEDGMRPRGGTTTGAPVTLATVPSGAYRRLLAAATPLQRDRAAILAMAGGYRATFDFTETLGFTDGYRPQAPYQSWGTEYIYVVADEPEFISLQHVLVMTLADETVSQPIVVKHWRQDWRYQDRDLHVYAGRNTWIRRTLPAAVVAGAWSQAVFQVDDSPRYEAVGHWEHRGNHATWTSEETWRPLPRREFSVRDDYDVLAGTNRVTITPLGWVQEEDNLKLVLGDDGAPAPDAPYLAREAGLNRYEHIVGYDFSAGDAYWQRTGPFWAVVRGAWDDLFAAHDTVRLAPRAPDHRLFEVMFQLADRFAGDDFDVEAGRQAVAAALEAFLTDEAQRDVRTGRAGESQVP